MKTKESKWWTVAWILVALALCSYFFVDNFKAANGQFYRDATHTYSEKICSGEDTSRVCTNYFFTEKQHNLNKIIDKLYLVLIVLVLGISYIQKTINPSEEDKKREQARMDPINTTQTAWEELMEENEKQKKDPNHGWTTSGTRTFLCLLFLIICFTIIGTYIEKSDILQNLLKIN
jgi:hypothetical protein